MKQKRFFIVAQQMKMKAQRRMRNNELKKLGIPQQRKTTRQN